jgi:hypothetical protein
MLIQEVLTEDQLNTLLESPTDLPGDATLVKQLEILMARLEGAKRALGITNRLTNAKDRKKHRARVMTFLNALRPMFERVIKQLQSEQMTDDTGIQPQYRMAA